MDKSIAEKPWAAFIQVQPVWRWLPFVSRHSIGCAFSWGCFLVGYIRSDARRKHLNGE